MTKVKATTRKTADVSDCQRPLKRFYLAQISNSKSPLQTQALLRLAKLCHYLD